MGQYAFRLAASGIRLNVLMDKLLALRTGIAMDPSRPLQKMASFAGAQPTTGQQGAGNAHAAANGGASGDGVSNPMYGGDSVYGGDSDAEPVYSAQPIFLHENAELDDVVYGANQFYDKYKQDKTAIAEQGYVKLVTEKRGQEIIDKLELRRDQITMGKVIGEGNYAEVCIGEMTARGVKTTVAIKVLKDNSPASSKLFEDEAAVMGSMSHPSVLKLVGVCLVGRQSASFLVMEYCSQGNLESYLEQAHDSGKTALHLGMSLLLSLGMDILHGMCYLEALNCVHRDLATRNILLDDTLRGKIADFGLSHQLAADEVYTTKTVRALPVKWMSPECVLYGKSTVKSDVWSFGIVLWEIFTLAEDPYGRILLEVATADVVQILMAKLEGGYRLFNPQYCPDTVYSVMNKCWVYKAEDRPTFSDLLPMLRAVACSVPDANQRK